MDYKAFYAEIGDWILQVNHMAMQHGMESNDFWIWISSSMGQLANKYHNNKLVIKQLAMLFAWLDEVYVESKSE